MCFIFFRAQTDDVKMDQYILYFSLIEIYLDMLNTWASFPIQVV